MPFSVRNKTFPSGASSSLSILSSINESIKGYNTPSEMSISNLFNISLLSRFFSSLLPFITNTFRIM
ncbi:hypothetical protein B66a [Sulfolobus turreted icosahedral virus 1]|uniref:Uncharacterized protein n=1 Tax=Sulfolobus turreted icosahedral virus 1 TaxID=269145 RepID=Q6Q0J8_9VIRU|nr:hypothetical protein B66a [Sulfolobus turreted icosahedral virus 1]AAS89093.1 hypothetical protein B66a [Sulfolobus turreted icosahedral virus 1]